MTTLTATANLVDPATHERADWLEFDVDRSELEALLASDGGSGLLFEIEFAGVGEAHQVGIELSDEDVRALLQTPGEDVRVAVDGEAVVELLAEPEVEAHGLRASLAIAAVAVSVAAPSALAATPASVGAAVSGESVSTEVTTQVVSAVVRPGIAHGATASTVARSSALTSAKLRVLRASVLRR